MAMVRAAKVRAASYGRNYVLPDDIKDLAPHVWTHRLVLDPEAEFAGATPEAVLTRVLATVGAPQHRSEAPEPAAAMASGPAAGSTANEANEDTVYRGGSSATGA
jgi:MoxR-like ATPase